MRTKWECSSNKLLLYYQIYYDIKALILFAYRSCPKMLTCLSRGDFICYKILQLNCWNSYGYVSKRFSRCSRVNGASLITATFV